MLTDLSKIQLSDKALLKRILQRFDEVRMERYRIETRIGTIIGSDSIDLFELNKLEKAKIANATLVKEYENLMSIISDMVTNKEVSW
jgi:hypothetical protein